MDFLTFSIFQLTHLFPAYLYAVKLPFRRSLASIGIPSHRDALAVYFHWVRQRYYRAQDVMGDELASSVRSVVGSCDASSRMDDYDLTEPRSRVQSDTERFRVDLLSIGAGFEGEAVALSYPTGIDVRG